MEKERYLKQRVASIRVEPYLASYARKKFEIDPKTGGINIPDNFDLYHCVWQLMQRCPKDAPVAEEPNLTIWLPSRRAIDGQPGKHPEYWNYLSPRSARLIEKSLRRLFNYEFHYYMDQATHGANPQTKVDAIRQFIRSYGIDLDSEDALIKNYQRYERTMKVFLGIKKGKNKKNR